MLSGFPVWIRTPFEVDKLLATPGCGRTETSIRDLILVDVRFDHVTKTVHPYFIHIMCRV